jgi:hypothetical protein
MTMDKGEEKEGIKERKEGRCNPWLTLQRG